MPLDEQNIIVVYCMYCKVRGPRCALLLKKAQPYLDVRILKGGFQNFLCIYPQHVEGYTEPVFDDDSEFYRWDLLDL